MRRGGRQIKAVLFDIDGTILNCDGAGRKALIQSTREVFGTCGSMERVDFQGKTDPVILTESLSMMGISDADIAEKAGILKQRYFFYLKENLVHKEITVFPGIRDIIDTLYRRDDILLGLLTGNFTESAMIKLAGCGLDTFFNFGAYGDDAPVRNLLPAVARKRIAENFRMDMAFKDMVIIGDTIHDVRCAKYSGAVSVAVATGWSARELLENERPDYCFNNLADTADFFRILED